MSAQPGGAAGVGAAAGTGNAAFRSSRKGCRRSSRKGYRNKGVLGDLEYIVTTVTAPLVLGEPPVLELLGVLARRRKM